MAEAEDYDFSGTDAGSSEAVPIEAGQIRKGGFMVIKVRHYLLELCIMTIALLPAEHRERARAVDLNSRHARCCCQISPLSH